VNLAKFTGQAPFFYWCKGNHFILIVNQISRKMAGRLLD